MDEIIISPYVTTKGGVVILNGPFLPIDRAYRIAALCKAAPDLLKACEKAEAYLQGIRSGRAFEESDLVVGILKAAIAKARLA